jgi:hypothetical protein
VVDFLADYELAAKPARLLGNVINCSSDYGTAVLDMLKATGIQGARDSSKPVGMLCATIYIYIYIGMYRTGSINSRRITNSPLASVKVCNIRLSMISN